LKDARWLATNASARRRVNKARGRGQRGAPLWAECSRIIKPSRLLSRGHYFKSQRTQERWRCLCWRTYRRGVKQIINAGRVVVAVRMRYTSQCKRNRQFWVKDGVLVKYEFNVQGTMTFNNNDINIDRTTTVEIKDIGSTKIDVQPKLKKVIITIFSYSET
jgi:hypothetical protein